MENYIITVTNVAGKMSFVGATSWAQVLELQIKFRGMGLTTKVQTIR